MIANGDPPGRICVTYDDAGRKVEEALCEADGTRFKPLAFYRYDQHGRLDQTVYSALLQDKGPHAREEYEYDKCGPLQQKLTRHADGSISTTQLYSYDEKGRKIEKRLYVRF